MSAFAQVRRRSSEQFEPHRVPDVEEGGSHHPRRWAEEANRCTRSSRQLAGTDKYLVAGGRVPDQLNEICGGKTLRDDIEGGEHVGIPEQDERPTAEAFPRAQERQVGEQQGAVRVSRLGLGPVEIVLMELAEAPRP